MDMEALKACEETLDYSTAVTKRCSAISCIGKPTERQCTGCPVKGTDLCARHTKSAMAKLLTSKAMANLLTSKRKRETQNSTIIATPLETTTSPLPTTPPLTEQEY
jgi:hypothetical protein